MSDETVVAIRRLQAAMSQSATGKLTAGQLGALRRTMAPTVWGAMAWDKSFQSSVVFLLPDRATAERNAKALCKKKTGKECQVSAIQTTRCVAFATSEGRIENTIHSASGVGHGANLEQARESAQLECRGISKTPNLCKVRHEVCADGSHKPQPAVAKTPSPQPQPAAGPAKAAVKPKPTDAAP
jgi:Domain of unknown function (DUF4189)